MVILSERAQKTIEVVEKVFDSKNVKIPLCISIVSDEGFELFSSEQCNPDEMDIIHGLGLVAYEELKSSFHTRTDQEINILIFRTREREFYVAPVAASVFLVASSDKGTVGNVMPFLDGLSAQVKFELSKLEV